MQVGSGIDHFARSPGRMWAPVLGLVTLLGLGSANSLGANLTTLVTFNSANGGPKVPLYADSSGNVYGTSTYMIFKIPAGTNTLTALAGYGDYEAPSELTMDSAGNLYGTTYYGGDGNLGSVFEIQAGGKGYKTLASFNLTTGDHPVSGVTLDSAGNIFGTAYYGGASNDGSIYEIAAGTSTITNLASFNGLNGAQPLGDLVADGAGHFYAATNRGGPNYEGTVFMFSPGTNAITPLAVLNQPNGVTPTAGVVLDSAGNLFGTTSTGGIGNFGTIFEIAAGTNKYTTLLTFNGNDGANPNGLIIDSAGNLFGTTIGGGTFGQGSVFEVAAGTSTITTLVSFNGADGASPYAGVTADSEGNLYGTTNQGGANNSGTVFEVTGSGFVTPEPSSLCLMALGAVGLLRRRRARMC